MKLQMRWLLPTVLILTFFALAPSNTYAQTEFLYANDNQSNTPNTVSGFSIGNNGKLKLLPGSPYQTGAAGGGGGFNISDVNGSIQVHGKFLYVANVSSISVFTIDPESGSLSLVPGSPFGIAGPTSGYGISLAVSHDNHFLFAGDFLESQVSVFTIAPNGSLTLVSISPFPIAGPPGGMKVTSGNKFLMISHFQQGIGVYKILEDGRITPIGGSPFPVPAWGIDVNCKANLLFVGRQKHNIGVLQLAADGSLTPIPGSPFSAPGANFIALSLNPTDTLLYVNDALTSHTLAFSVAADGRLTLVPGSPFRVNAQVTGLVPEEDNKFVYVAGGLAEEVFSFAVGPHGRLDMVPGSPFSTGEGGDLTSLATFPGKDCR